MIPMSTADYSSLIPLVLTYIFVRAINGCRAWDPLAHGPMKEHYDLYHTKVSCNLRLLHSSKCPRATLLDGFVVLLQAALFGPGCE